MCLTNGQWLQINITTVATSDFSLDKVIVCPEIASFKLNSGALVPKGIILDSRTVMVILLFYTCDNSRYGQEKMNERPQRTMSYVRTGSEILTNPDLEVAQVYLSFIYFRGAEDVTQV